MEISSVSFVDAVLMLARVLMASIFINSAIAKISGDPGELKAMQAVHIPFPGMLEKFAGACEVIGAAMLVLGVGTRLGAWLLLAFMVVTTILFLRYWTVKDSQVNRLNMRNTFFSNLSTIAGLAYIGSFGPGTWALMPRH